MKRIDYDRKVFILREFMPLLLCVCIQISKYLQHVDFQGKFL